MTSKPVHISVCICTYKRPEMLRELLIALRAQQTRGLTFSVVVVDNDVERSAEHAVAVARDGSSFGIDYHVQPDRNIALARNGAVLNAAGDFIAFIDDDEVPVADWLQRLYDASIEYKADAVLGPVKPKFQTPPPGWVIDAELFERPSYPTGTVLAWKNTRTGNVLIERRVFDEGILFRPEFRHSEDQDFFKRFMQSGRQAVWCDEAVVYEIQRAERFTVGYFLKRALLRGNVGLKLQTNKLQTIVKSLVAVPVYTLSLPILAVRPYLFVKFLIKDCDHAGKLIAACRIDIQKYLT